MGTSALRAQGTHRGLAVLLAALAGLAISGASEPRSGVAGTCPSDTIGTDLASANLIMSAFFGRAWNQAFVAEDTLVSAITVWRAALPETSFQGMHLFITGVDPLHQDRPVVDPVLFDGPVLIVPSTDHVNPERVRFELDPPFPLPHKGKFSFAVKDNYRDYHVSLLADTTNPYPEGELWKSFANNDCSGLGGADMAMPILWDLIFEVEFCRPELVPTRQQTWGEVKSIYR